MKKPADDRYGVNMRQFCRRHEEAMERALAGGGASRALLERHLEKLRWLQHERLIHLIVLAMTVVGELFFLFLSLTCQTANPAAAALALLLAVLLAFYFRHYFFLENTTQHWYRLAERIMQALDSDEK